MTPQQLFDFANNYARNSESSGRGTKYPSFAEVSRRFRASHSAIESACADWDQSLGYMNPAVAVGGSGGICSIKSRGEYLVEAYI